NQQSKNQQSKNQQSKNQQSKNQQSKNQQSKNQQSKNQTEACAPGACAAARRTTSMEHAGAPVKDVPAVFREKWAISRAGREEWHARLARRSTSVAALPPGRAGDAAA
ncbi:MAG: hypothetical protein KGS47_12915, partial [Chloroflexi bacterium]|nr:hypothetical protein [Chloroflexota bacterium]